MVAADQIRLRDVHKYFADEHILKGIDLAIADGELMVLVGPSGCGKSTLLRVLAGLEGVTAGTVEIGGVDMTALGAAERGLAMVFQSYALYPHMSVRENIGFGLKVSGQSASTIAAAVDRAAKMLQLEPLLARKPKDLSGGQRQRVAIGRAIVRNPAAFLFDEPLSNLDAALRVQMRLELAQLHQQLGKTMVYVTHDQVEAMTLADRIVVMNHGVIQQIGPPMTLYRDPANLFVATFIGSPKMNVLPCESGPGGIRMAHGGELAIGSTDGVPSHVGVRCEHIRLIDTVDGGNAVPGRVLVVEHLGSESYVYVDVGADAPVTVRTDAQTTVQAGESTNLQIDCAQAFLFAADGQRIASRVIN